MVPQIAGEFGLKVNIGAWIDKNQARNEREMRSVVDLAKRHSNTVNGIVVGNETILRAEQTVDELIKKIQRIKRETQGQVPITTGETWDVWMSHPELASAVDYIAAHILPVLGRVFGEGGGRPGDHGLRPVARGLSRQARGDRRIRLAERGLQSPAGQSRAARTGGRAAHLPVEGRGLRDRLQHHRSHRPAVEDLRRRRRSLLGPVRRLPSAEVQLDRADHRSPTIGS